MDKLITCIKCKQEKTEDLFYNDKSKPSGKRPRCKECDKLSINKELRIKYEREYYSDPERREKKKKKIRASMKKYAKKYAEKRKEYLKTEKGQAVYRAYTQKRYAIRKKAFVEDVEPMELFDEQKGICYLCGKKFDFCEMELDHVHPISKGGKHEKANCKMACASCNRSKGSKTLEELSYQMV